jgi:hypothetical protein
VLSSATFHVALWVVASLAALGAAIPRASVPKPRVLHAELGPVDNRAPAEAGGGSEGELGGDGTRPTVDLKAEAPPAGDGPTREDIADALLAEALPGPAMREPAPGAITGVSTSGLGLLVGPEAGGGGGSGGGAGGGIGRGVGAGTEFFGARERAGSFAYVIDCSGSMIEHDALEVAKRELLSSLEQLPPDARFAILFYNDGFTLFHDAQGRPGLMPATAANKDRVRTRLAEVRADGATQTYGALSRSLELEPEVVFLLTDGQALTHEHVEALARAAGAIRIHTIEFGGGPVFGDDAPLPQLAARTGGTFRHIDVRAFDAPASAR